MRLKCQATEERLSNDRKSWPECIVERETPALTSPLHDRDLDLVVYKISDRMQQRVYQTKVQNADDSRQRLVDVWECGPLPATHRLVSQSSLCLYIQARAGHFECSLYVMKS